MKNLAGLALFALLSTTAAFADCKKPWVFSDLGANTLVDTSQYDFDHETGPITAAPGALEYLRELAHAGYTVGLIVNVPAEWGATDDAKIFKITDMIDHNWASKEPLNWKQFGKIRGNGEHRTFKGRFFVPDTNEHRKPDPYLFNKAAAMAKARGCKSVYLSSLVKEMPGAEAAGMAAFYVGHTDPANRFLPAAKIPTYVRDYKDGNWNGGTP